MVSVSTWWWKKVDIVCVAFAQISTAGKRFAKTNNLKLSSAYKLKHAPISTWCWKIVDIVFVVCAHISALGKGFAKTNYV